MTTGPARASKREPVSPMIDSSYDGLAVAVQGVAARSCRAAGVLRPAPDTGLAGVGLEDQRPYRGATPRSSAPITGIRPRPLLGTCTGLGFLEGSETRTSGAV
jgi:hypothetical protein